MRRLQLERFSGLYLWAGFIVVFTIWAPSTFATMDTVHSVAAQNAVAGMLAIAILVPLSAGHYDLSVGACANMCGVLTVVLQTNQGWDVLPAIAAGIVAGAVVGLVNSLLVVKVGVGSLIATLGTGSILAAIQVIITGNVQPPPPSDPLWGQLTQEQVFGFQIVVFYLLLVGLVVWWLLECTPMGRYIFAIGGNPEAARLSGVRVDLWSAVSLIASGILSSVAGIAYVSLSGPSLAFGPTLLLPAFAAAFLGATQLKPGRFNVWGTILAIYVLSTGVQGFQLVSGQQWLNDMFNGVALILAVSLAVYYQRRIVNRRALTPRQNAGNESEISVDKMSADNLT